jgi:ribosomal subunit interface protein
MKLTYTGKLEKLDAPAQRKLDTRIEKLGALMDGRGEKKAHVILDKERHLHRAEITANFYDHPVVGAATGEDKFSALLKAFDKLEKQIVKLKSKWRDTKRNGGPTIRRAPAEAVPASNGPGPRIRAGKLIRQKPMGAEEAVLELNAKRDYVAYVDLDTGRVSVLVRCRDGNFDLIET